MTEAEFFELVLGIKEIQVDRVDWQDQCLHIYCSSAFEEALCPQCLNKRPVINQTYERQFRDLPITGKEVYLHLKGSDNHRNGNLRQALLAVSRTSLRHEFPRF